MTVSFIGHLPVTVSCRDDIERQIRTYHQAPGHLVAWAVIECVTPNSQPAGFVPMSRDLHDALFTDGCWPGIQDVADMEPVDGDPTLWAVYAEYPGIHPVCHVRLLDHPKDQLSGRRA
jgi:hypothetical protein